MGVERERSQTVPPRQRKCLMNEWISLIAQYNKKSHSFFFLNFHLYLSPFYNFSPHTSSFSYLFFYKK